MTGEPPDRPHWVSALLAFLLMYPLALYAEYLIHVLDFHAILITFGILGASVVISYFAMGGKG